MLFMIMPGGEAGAAGWVQPLWLKLDGGLDASGNSLPFTVAETTDGIEATGNGTYDPSGHAVGLVRTRPVNLDGFSVEFTIGDYAGVRDNGVLNFFNFNLLDQPAYFSHDAPASARGIVVAVFPKNATTVNVEVYRISEEQPGDGSYPYRTDIPGKVGIGGGDVTVASLDAPLLFTLDYDRGNSKLYLNNTEIAGSFGFGMVDWDWFGTAEQAYFSIGAAASTMDPFSYTLNALNGEAASLTPPGYHGQWNPLTGGILNNGGNRAGYTAYNTEDGIAVTGSGRYEDSGQAAGLVLEQPVTWNDFAVEFRIDQIAGLEDQGVGSWFNFNLLDQPRYFNLIDAASARGLNVMVIPKNASQIRVEVYRIAEEQPGDAAYPYQSGIPGRIGIGGGTYNIAWGTPLHFEVRDAGSGNALYLNGNMIAYPGFMSQINSGWFGTEQEGYFSIGAAAWTDASFGYTLQTINGLDVSIPKLVPYNMLEDITFEAGAQVYDPGQGAAIVNGTLGFGKSIAGKTPRWIFTQWNSLSDLATIQGQRIGSKYVYENSYKKVALADDGTLTLGVNAELEYSQPRTQVSDPWLHLYLEQRNSQPKPLTGDSLQVQFDMRITESVPLMDEEEIDPGLHATIAVFYMTLVDLDGSGDFINFCIPLYDNREAIPSGGWHIDNFGPSAGLTNQLIYTMEGGDLYQAPTGNGQWHRVDVDIKPYAEEALLIAQQNGFLENLSYADLGLGSMFVGWEVPGIFKNELQIKNMVIHQ